MAVAKVERRLAAILMADVVRYSALIEQDETGTLAALAALRRDVLQPALAEHHGHMVKTLGDGFLVEFASVVDAVACAVSIQRKAALPRSGSGPDKRLVLRIGINLGDVIVEDGDLLGDGVNVAARLEQLCDPGGVLISGTAYDHLHGKLGLPLAFAGEQMVKNIARPVRVYRVNLDGTPLHRRLRLRPYAPYLKWVAAIAGVLVAAGIAWTVFAPGGPPGESSAMPSVAVLPFSDLSGEPASSYYGNGVAEDIITMLSRVPELKVLARSSSFAPGDQARDPRALGEELGVSHLLQGSVRREGDRVRIIAQLVDAKSGEQLWADRFDRSGSDPWALQDEVAARIVADLVGDQGTLRLAQYSEAWGKDSAELEEYDYYLRAHDLARRLLPDSNEKARAIAEQGLAKYPASPLLKLELGYTYFLSGWNGWSDDLMADYARTGDLVQEAVAEPVLSPMERRLGHFLSAFVEVTRRNFKEALGQAEAAIALSPHDVYMLASLSQIPVMAGNPEEALEWMDRAALLDTNPEISQEIAFYRGWALAVQGRWQESLDALEKDQRGNDLFTPMMRAIVLRRLGRIDEAMAEFRKGLAVEPKFTQATWRELFFYSDPSIVDREIADLAGLGLPEK